MPRTTTTAGEYVSPTNDVCGRHMDQIATAAVYWTDDDQFPAESVDATYWTDRRRFLKLQEAITDYRADCRDECGRVTTP